MKTLRTFVVVCSSLSVGFWFCGCGGSGKTDALPPNALAVVGDQVITVEAFREALATRAHQSPGKYDEPKEKAALLEEMVRLEVLHQKALAAGYDKDPVITANLKRMIASKYQEDQVAKLGRPTASPEEIADYYRKNPHRFGTPAKVRVALIELKVARTATPEKRAEVARKAEAVLAEARNTQVADGTFGLVAQNHSEDQASRYQGGDIGWVTVGDTNAPWAPAVLAGISQLTQPGDLAPVIETPTAFYVLKLVERKPATVRPLEDLKDGIQYLVARQKEQQQLEDFHNSLKQGLKIRTNQALLESIRAPEDPRKAPGMPGG